MIDEEILSVVKEIREKLGYAVKLSSVEITKTTRGYTWTVKTYAENPELACEKSVKIDEELKKKFPSEVLK